MKYYGLAVLVIHLALPIFSMSCSKNLNYEGDSASRRNRDISRLESPLRAERIEAVRSLEARPSDEAVLAIVRSFRYETAFVLHGSPTGRTFQSEYLARHPHEAFPALIEGLKNNDANVRRHSAFTIGVMGDPSKIKPLEGALSSELASVDRFQLTADKMTAELLTIRTITEAMRRLDAHQTVDYLLQLVEERKTLNRQLVIEDCLSRVVRPEALTFRCSDDEQSNGTCLDRWQSWWSQAQSSDVLRH
jgi:hypothetical protein